MRKFHSSPRGESLWRSFRASLRHARLAPRSPFRSLAAGYRAAWYSLRRARATGRRRRNGRAPAAGEEDFRARARGGGVGKKKKKGGPARRPLGGGELAHPVGAPRRPPAPARKKKTKGGKTKNPGPPGAETPRDDKNRHNR